MSQKYEIKDLNGDSALFLSHTIPLAEVAPESKTLITILLFSQEILEHLTSRITSCKAGGRIRADRGVGGDGSPTAQTNY